MVKEKNTNKEETSKNSLLTRIVTHLKMTDKQKITEFIATRVFTRHNGRSSSNRSERKEVSNNMETIDLIKL